MFQRLLKISMEDVSKFTREDVRRHLTELGYSNIEESKLDEFCADLRKLIKYEEKKKKIGQKLEMLEQNQKRIEADKENDSTSTSLEMPKRKRRIRREEKQRLKEEKLRARVQARSLSESEIDSRVHDNVDHGEPGEVSEEVEGSSLYIDVDLPAERPSSSKSQPLAASLLEQPPPGFIRVRSGPNVGKKPAECDPVSLHQKYQTYWERFQVPGEKRHDKLRWAVRGWMMGEEPV